MQGLDSSRSDGSALLPIPTSIPEAPLEDLSISPQQDKISRATLQLLAAARAELLSDEDSLQLSAALAISPQDLPAHSLVTSDAADLDGFFDPVASIAEAAESSPAADSSPTTASTVPSARDGAAGNEITASSAAQDFRSEQRPMIKLLLQVTEAPPEASPPVSLGASDSSQGSACSSQSLFDMQQHSELQHLQAAA